MVSQTPLSGTQGQVCSARRSCPDCSSRLYGAHGISGRPASTVWVCRTASCGFFRGNLAANARRCPCSAVVVPGTGGEFQSATGLVYICSSCTELHPGGAPKAILDQHTRILRAQAQQADYEFSRNANAGELAVDVLNTKTGASYTVQATEQPVCNCPDFRKRCEGTALRCKHITMSQSWLAGQPVPEPEAVAADEPGFPMDLVTTRRDVRLADLEARASRAQEALDAKVSAERQAILSDAETELTAARMTKIRSEMAILWPDA